MKRLIAMLAATGAALLALGAPAQADYPPGQIATLVAVPAVGGPGYTVTATVSNCYPGESLTFTLVSSTATATCSTTTFQATVQLTAPAAVGFYDVTVPLAPIVSPLRAAPQALPAGNAAMRPRTLTAQIQVVEQEQTTTSSTTTTTTTPSGQLPASGEIPTTGSSGLNTTATVAIVLLVGGLALVAVAQVRRRQSSAS